MCALHGLIEWMNNIVDCMEPPYSFTYHARVLEVVNDNISCCRREQRANKRGLY